MTTLQDLSSRIKDVNLKIEGINRERQINIGKQQTLKKQLDSALSDYEKKYGVKLTLETIEAEVNAITSQYEEKVECIEKVLALVGEKRYAEAEKLLGVSREGETSQPAETGSAGTTEMAGSSAEKLESAPPTFGETLEEMESVPPTFEDVAEKPEPASSTELPATGGTPEKLETAPPTFGSIPASYDDEEDIPAPPPPTFGKPSNRSITSFGDILNNASFNPQG